MVDPACPETPAVVQDALTFARAHPDVAVRIWLATRPTRSRDGMRLLVTAAEAGATVTWAPGAVRRLAPAALPAVYLEDRRGRGARATGRPPLEALWRTVVQESGSMTVPAADREPRAMPQPLDHALAQLRRRRVLLVPAEAESASDGRKRYPVRLTRSLLSRVPSSPALRDALAAAPAGKAVFGGHAWLAPDERPRLALDGLGGIWRLALPGRRGTFATLREIRTPRDLRPAVSRLVEVAPGVVERRHRIPLRYHPGAWLVVAVSVRPEGRARYDAWVWHAGRRRASALWWEEARRVIELFRDLAASWFWVGPPPVASGAGSNGRPSTHGDRRPSIRSPRLMRETAPVAVVVRRDRSSSSPSRSARTPNETHAATSRAPSSSSSRRAPPSRTRPETR